MKANVGGFDQVLRIMVGLVLVIMTIGGVIGSWGYLGLIVTAFYDMSSIRRAWLARSYPFLLLVLGGVGFLAIIAFCGANAPHDTPPRRGFFMPPCDGGAAPATAGPGR